MTFSRVCLLPGAVVGHFSLPSRPGNPVYGPHMQLYCRTGFHIGIFPTGRVNGIQQDHHEFGKLVYLVMIKDSIMLYSSWEYMVSEWVIFFEVFIPDSRVPTRLGTAIFFNSNVDTEDLSRHYFVCLLLTLHAKLWCLALNVLKDRLTRNLLKTPLYFTVKSTGNRAVSKIFKRAKY